MLKVSVANDDVTPMEFVVVLLESLFEKSCDDATQVMLEAHENGSAVCGLYPEARARELAAEATALAQKAGYPLQFSAA
jgi:ATP-dependent Clp protease adaptor protein ClpS